MKVEVRDSDAIAGVRPRAAYAPATLDECAEVMAMAARERLLLGFVGGRTALAMGAAPSGLDAVVRRELPATLDECAEVMAMAARERLLLGFVGGRTALAMGAAPSGLDAVVRSERLV